MDSYYLSARASSNLSYHHIIISSCHIMRLIHYDVVRASLSYSWSYFCTPANAVSLLENRHFLSHRPPMNIYHFHENRVQDSPGLTGTHHQPFSFKIIKAKHVLLKGNRHFLQDRPPSGRSEFFV